MGRSVSRIPDAFRAAMSVQFGRAGLSGELDAFLESFEDPPWTGIRANPLKVPDPDAFRMRLSDMNLADLQQVPWSTCGYVLPPKPDPPPGTDPYYHAGLFYLQEPSAMLPAEVLGARPGERVLDLCAAPGGKATRIAADMKGEGLLFANDIQSTRVRALVRNLELSGVANAVVLNESPERLAARLPAWFDRILVDAPCSGEGMFRRDRQAVSSWERFGPESSAALQDAILEQADRLLRPGGILTYATCTFSWKEDEGTIARFLTAHPEYEVLPIPRTPGLSGGMYLPDEPLPTEKQAACMVRIWPHKAAADGHFCAKLRKRDGRSGPVPATEPDRSAGVTRTAIRDMGFPEPATAGWLTERATGNEDGRREGRHIYRLPEAPPDLSGLRVVRPGLSMGTVSTAGRSVRYSPSHAFLLSLNGRTIRNGLDLTRDDPRLIRYLKGETLRLDEDLPDGYGGWIPVSIGGYPLGWAGKAGPRSLKNRYPKAWRRMK